MSGWKVWADYYENAEFTSGSKTVRTRFNSNIVLEGARVWIVLFNNPTFTNISMDIHGDESNSKGKLLATSTNTLSKSQIITLENGVKEIYFSFDKFPIDGEKWYHFSLRGAGPAFNETTHLAWLKGWPDPVYRKNLSITFEKLLVFPYTIYFIGAEF